MDARECAPQELLGELNEHEQKNAPPRLYLRGDASLLTGGHRISVVGTREPTAEGVGRTKALVDVLVARDIIVVSGLAKGIDTIAHSHAIARGGRTIAVLGNPLNVFFPSENRALQEEIGRHHLLVSQFASGSKGGAGNFPRRNRTMALLSEATIIIEAGEGSGTLHQGWEAIRLGRPLFLLESLVQRSDLTWPAEMIEYGAEILTREKLDAVLEEIPWRSFGELPF
ncbi:MAG: DNA-processing protein DprA [Planctomycetota bacterium]